MIQIHCMLVTVDDGVSKYNTHSSAFPPREGILILVSFIIANCFHNIFKHFISKWKENKTYKVRESKVIQSEAKLNEIQSSVNPHFLYNSFNSIASLAKKDPQKTEQMTLALSKFYKYTTNREEASYSTIQEEIEMINTYLEIEKIRFGEKPKF